MELAWIWRSILLDWGFILRFDRERDSTSFQEKSSLRQLKGDKYTTIFIDFTWFCTCKPLLLIDLSVLLVISGIPKI